MIYFKRFTHILSFFLILISTQLSAQPHIFSGPGDGFGDARYLGTLGGHSIVEMFGGGMSDGYDQKQAGGSLNGISAIGPYSSGKGDGFSAERFLGTLAGDNLSVMFRAGIDDGFSQQQSGLLPLEGVSFPIALLSFDAFPKEDFVLLQWVTASEVNHDFFTIERSEDASFFTDLSHVQGPGTSFDKIAYEERDYEPLAGASYYRLTSNDFDGSVSHSHIVEVNVDVRPEWDMSIYPNPNLGDRLNLRLTGMTTGQAVSIEMVDMSGKLSHRQSLTAEQAIIYQELPLPDGVPAGSYLIRVSSEQGQLSKILIIQ